MMSLSNALHEVGLTARYSLDYLVDPLVSNDRFGKPQIPVESFLVALLCRETVLSHLVGVSENLRKSGLIPECENSCLVPLGSLVRNVAQLANDRGHSEVTCVHFVYVLIHQFRGAVVKALEQLKQTESSLDCARGSNEQEALTKPELIYSFEYLIGDIQQYLDSPYYPFGSVEYDQFKRDHRGDVSGSNTAPMGFLAHAVLDARYKSRTV